MSPKFVGVFTPRVQSQSLVIEAKVTTKREDRTARHTRIRKKVEGTTERPRLCVFCSNKHLYVQVIDDTKMHTLASASTMQKPISEEFDFTSGPTIEVAKKVGEVIAKSCLEKGITKVAFDRGSYPYHGRVEAVANAAKGEWPSILNLRVVALSRLIDVYDFEDEIFRIGNAANRKKM